jgi:hypothetical protein
MYIKELRYFEDLGGQLKRSFLFIKEPKIDQMLYKASENLLVPLL